MAFSKTKRLDEELIEIKSGFKRQHRVYMSSRDMLYDLLVDAYLWWRKASRVKGYLAKTYAVHNITHNKGRDFHPLLKLFAGMTQKKDSVKISQFAANISFLHKEYEKRPDVYGTGESAHRGLINWIKESGGFSSLRKDANVLTESYGLDSHTETATKKPASKQPTEQQKKDELKSFNQVVNHKKEMIRTAHTGAVNVEHDIGRLNTDEDQLVVLLARKNTDTGKVTIVGSSVDNTIINNVVHEIGHIDVSLLSENIRSIVEAFRINIIPKQFKRLNLDKHFYPESKVKGLRGDDSYKLKQTPRLRIREDGSVLVSKSCSDVSVVTILNPINKFELKNDVFLRGVDREWLESSIINAEKLSLYIVNPKHGLGGKKQGLKAAKHLALTNTITNHKRNIYFYDVYESEDNLITQANIVDGIQYDWEIQGTQEFFKMVFKQHFEEYIEGVGRRITLPRNRTMKFAVHNDKLEVQAKWSKEEEVYQQVGPHPDSDTCFGEYAELVSGDAGSEFTFSPLDAYRVFESFDTYAHIDDIQMMGNESVCCLKWHLEDVGDFTVYIPACNTGGKRDSIYFEAL